MQGFISKILLFFSFLLIQIGANGQELKVGDQMPEIALDNVNQTPISLKAVNKDKYVLVNFYCPINGNLSVGYYNDLLKIHKQYANTAVGNAKGYDMYSVCFHESMQNFVLDLENTDFPYYKFPNNVLEITNSGPKGALTSPLKDKLKLKGFPTNVLIDETGKILLINGKAAEIEALLKKKPEKNDKLVNLFAKLLYGEKKNKALTKQKISLVNGKGVVLGTTETDDFGDFSFKQVNVSEELLFKLEASEQLKKINEVYVAKQNGVVVSTITKNTTGEFKYKLLEKDIIQLSEMEEVDDPALKIENFGKSAAKELTIVENIYYPKNEFKISEKSGLKLDVIADQMKKNKTVKLEIVSHTDAVGDDASNLELSKKRAQAALEYLVKKGVETSRLKSTGKGETNILNRCANGINCSEKEQELNRRTEFKFIK